MIRSQFSSRKFYDLVIKSISFNKFRALRNVEKLNVAGERFLLEFIQLNPWSWLKEWE